MITDKIKDQILKAMKARDEVRLSTLKMLSSALTNAEIEKNREKLTEEEELKVVQREAKKRKDAMNAYGRAGEQERSEQEKKELEILKEYLPEDISSEELEKIVSDSIKQSGAASMADMGKVMGLVMGKVGGRADGNEVSAIVKSKLS